MNTPAFSFTAFTRAALIVCSTTAVIAAASCNFRIFAAEFESSRYYGRSPVAAAIEEYEPTDAPLAQDPEVTSAASSEPADTIAARRSVRIELVASGVSESGCVDVPVRAPRGWSVWLTINDADAEAAAEHTESAADSDLYVFRCVALAPGENRLRAAAYLSDMAQPGSYSVKESTDFVLLNPITRKASPPRTFVLPQTAQPKPCSAWRSFFGSISKPFAATGGAVKRFFRSLF